MSRFTILYIVIAAFFIGIPTTILGQDEKPEDPWVYVQEYQIPLDQMGTLDSLLNLETTKTWRETAIKMGFILNQRFYINHTRNEWNYRIENVFSSQKAMHNPGWHMKVFNVVFPDDDKRNKILSDWGRLYEGVTHREHIYRLALGR